MILNKTKEIAKLKNNLKIMQERNEDLYKRDLEHQKKYQEEIKRLKEENTELKFELEDAIGFLKQERQAKEELLRQRNRENARKRTAAKKKKENK